MPKIRAWLVFFTVMPPEPCRNRQENECDAHNLHITGFGTFEYIDCYDNKSYLYDHLFYLILFHSIINILYHLEST